MREYRVIDAWKPRGKNAGNGSISSGGTVDVGERSLLPWLVSNFTIFDFLFIAYCDELVSKIIQICSLNDYHYVTDFEW